MFSRQWSDQAILDSIKKWAEEHGEPPTFNQWVQTDGSHPSSRTVQGRCGSWNDALVMAGFEPRPPHGWGVQRFDREEALRLREQGLNDRQVGRLLGVQGQTIGKALGPRPRPAGRPRTAEARRQQRIDALKRALEKEEEA